MLYLHLQKKKITFLFSITHLFNFESIIFHLYIKLLIVFLIPPSFISVMDGRTFAMLQNPFTIQVF